MSVDPAQTLVLARFTALLEELRVTYAVGGSIACGYWGEPRSTYDVDVLADLRPEHAAGLIARLQEGFIVDAEDIRANVERGATFHVVHERPIGKVDVFLPGANPLDREQLERRVQQPLADGDARLIWVTSAEVIVLRKLDWFRIGQLVSDRQWRDVLGVLKAQTGSLDVDYMLRAAKEVGLDYLLRRAFADAGLEAGE